MKRDFFGCVLLWHLPDEVSNAMLSRNRDIYIYILTCHKEITEHYVIQFYTSLSKLVIPISHMIFTHYLIT